MNNEIKNKIENEKTYLMEKYRISKIGIFGSFARGEETANSDVDILVEFTSVPDLFEFFEIEEYLEKLLHKKIDLVRENAIKHQIKDQIMSEVQYI